jgi:hypothetical protein
MIGWLVVAGLLAAVVAQPSTGVNISQADFSALNSVFYNFNAAFSGQVFFFFRGGTEFCRQMESPTPPPPPVVVFDVCLQGCSLPSFLCNSEGHPTTLAIGRPTLDLYSVNDSLYVATLSSAIGNLNSLTSLEIVLPAIVWVSEVTRLSNLRTLTISEQSRLRTSAGTVVVPKSTPPMTLPTFLGALSGLTRLAVESRSMVEIPTELGLLSALNALDLNCPNLTSFPSELGLLRNLTTIRLAAGGGQLPSAFEGKRFLRFEAIDSKLSGKLPLFVFDGPADACQLRGNQFDTNTSLCPFGCQCDRTVVLQPPLTLPTTEQTTTATIATTTRTLAFVAPDELSSALANLTMTLGIALGAVGAVMLIGFIVMCIVIVKLRGRLANNNNGGGSRDIEPRPPGSAPSPYTTIPHQNTPQAQPVHYNNANIEFASTRSERQLPPPLAGGTPYTDMGSVHHQPQQQQQQQQHSGYYGTDGGQGFGAFHQHSFQQ